MTHIGQRDCHLIDEITLHICTELLFIVISVPVLVLPFAANAGLFIMCDLWCLTQMIMGYKTTRLSK